MLLLCFEAAGIEQCLAAMQSVVHELQGHGVKHHSSEFRLMRADQTLEETVRQGHMCIATFDHKRSSIAFHLKIFYFN